MLKPLCIIVRLTATSPSGSDERSTGHSSRTAVVSSTPNQYAGYSRQIREVTNSPIVWPMLLMQITKPLIRKNNSTPSQPYAATGSISGTFAYGVSPPPCPNAT